MKLWQKESHSFNVTFFSLKIHIFLIFTVIDLIISYIILWSSNLTHQQLIVSLISIICLNSLICPCRTFSKQEM